MKVMTVVGTRPEIIRLSRVMAALDRYMEQILVHTGQNYDYELNQVFFEDLELRKPDHFLEAAGRNASETVGQIIARVDRVLEQEQPDALLVLGDTNSCLAAYPAKRRKIPVFHMEAGNRCFDQRVPEEINRQIVDHISDINMPYSSISREYLLAEGLPADRIIKTGSPMYEVLHHYLPKINASLVLEQLGLEEQTYFLVECSPGRKHRCPGTVRPVAGGLERTGGTIRQATDRLHSPANPQPAGSGRGAAAPPGAIEEAHGILRLCETADACLLRAVGQWNDYRGEFHPQFPGPQYPERPRKAGRI